MPADPLAGGARREGSRARPSAWQCPSCRAHNTSVFEDGCPSCGAGTKAANDRAQREVEAAHRLVAPEELARCVVEGVVANNTGDEILGLQMFTPAAKVTILRALTTYLQYPAEPDELPKAVVRAWARRLAGE